MDWCDIDDILLDGDKETISKIVCPECGSKISYKYSEKYGNMEIKCSGCGYLSRASGFPFPNCVKYFGNSNIV